MRRAFRLGRLFVAFVTVMVVGAACVSNGSSGNTGGNQRTQGGGVIKIGVIGPFSGIAASVGRNMNEGVQIAVNELNAKGGVLGDQIEVVTRDDQFSPAKDAQVARELVDQDHVSMIIGPAGTSNYLAIGPFLQQSKVVDLPIVVDPVLRTHIDPYTFRLMIPDDIELNVLAAYAVKHDSKVAMIAEDDESGHSEIKIAEREFGKLGSHLVDVEQFSTTALDLTPLVLKLKQSGADAVILGTHIGPYAARILTAAQTLGYHPQFLGLAGLTSYTLADLAGNAVSGLIFIAPATPILTGGAIPPAARRFYSEYVKQYFPDGIRSASGANKVIGAAFLTYDGVQMWARAATDAHSADPTAVQRVMNGGFTFGPADSSADLTWHYDATNHDGFQQRDAWFFRWVHDAHGYEFKPLGDAAKLVG